MRIPTLACLLVTLLCPVIAGCVTSSYVSVGDKTYPPRPDDYVIEVYVDSDAPVDLHQSLADAKPTNEIPAGMELIGRIDTTGDSYANWSDMVKDAKEKARILGGDAIVIGGGGRWVGMAASGYSYDYKKLSIRVLRSGSPRTSATVFEAAANGSDTGMERLLASGADVNSRDADGNTPLHVAAEYGHYRVARRLVDYGTDLDVRNNQGATPLHKASAMGDYETARLLIERGADVKATTAFGDTPLHLAAEMRNFDMAQIVSAMGLGSNYDWKEDNLKVAELLIEHGADVNAQNQLGRTPLQRTTPWNHLPVARLLVESGADIELADADGMTPLQHARAKGARDVAAYLQKRTRR